MDTKRINILCYEEENGNTDTVCAVSSNNVTDDDQRQEIHKQLAENLHLDREDDPEVITDFETMVDTVLSGFTAYWLDYVVYWKDIDLIN
jgi:hypothetical protein